MDPPQAWPTSVRLPANVHVFPAGRSERFLAEREGIAVASVVGTSREEGQAMRPADFALSPDGLFTVAVVHATAEPEALRSRGIDYWALGGSHVRKTLYSDAQTAHDPGTPQGRDPSQVGTHGCTLVEVDAERHARTTFVPADVMRWHSERIVVDRATTRADLQSRIEDRILALRQANPGTDLFISWTIVGEGPLVARARHGGLAAELLETLRSEHGFASPAVWSTSFSAEPLTIVPPSWYEEPTIRGDFLRQLRGFETEAPSPVALGHYLAEQHRGGPLAAAATIAPGPERERVLREAAMLGVDLLSGEGPQP